MITKKVSEHADLQGMTPPGLTLISDIIDWSYESSLIQEIDKHEWETFIGRRVQHYGFRYNYTKRKVEDKKTSAVADIPSWATKLCQHLLDKKHISSLPNQLIVNEYKKNQGITKHTDHPMFGDVIFSVSLGAPCNMIFRRGMNVHGVKIQPLMFLKMEGETRSLWTHEIPPLKLEDNHRRISLTFRYVDEAQFVKST